MRIGESLHQRAVAAIRPGQSDLIEELRGADVERSILVSKMFGDLALNFGIEVVPKGVQSSR